MQQRRARTILLVSLLVGVAFFADQAEGNQPKAVAEEMIKDFRTVNKGKRLVHEFVIRNDGDAVLEITEVKPSCGCTVAEYPSSIPPGGSGVIKAAVDTRNLKGGIAKSVRVYTSDPENPQINLVIKANVKSAVEVDPGYARFIAVYGEPQKNSVQTIWSDELQRLRITKVESPYPFVGVSYRQVPEGEGDSGISGNQWQIEVKLDQEAPVGPMADFIVVTTNHPKLQTLRIPISGFVRPVLSVTPRIADFGRRELTEPQTASLEIRNLSSRAVDLGEASTSLEGLEAAVESVESGRLYKVLLTLSPGMPKGAFEGLVTIDTNSDRQPTIEVSVKGVVL